LQEQQPPPQPADPDVIAKILGDGAKQYVAAVEGGGFEQAAEALKGTLTAASEELMNAEKPPNDPQQAMKDLYTDFAAEADRLRPGRY